MSGLIWHQAEHAFAVTGVDGERVRVGRTWVETSFWVYGQQQSSWAPRSLVDLHIDHLDVLLALRPDVILLGTGLQHRNAPPALLAHALRAGVGFEAMSTNAAARTFNVLSGEGRAVLGAFLIGSG
jgi:uncharacterized protein